MADASVQGLSRFNQTIWKTCGMTTPVSNSKARRPGRKYAATCYGICLSQRPQKSGGSTSDYNPAKHGRASFKEKVGISGLTNEVINLTLEHGKHHTHYELEAFIRKCRILLPAEWALKRVRIDSGGFDIDNLNYLDQHDLEFLIIRNTRACSFSSTASIAKNTFFPGPTSMRPSSSMSAITACLTGRKATDSS